MGLVSRSVRGMKPLFFRGGHPGLKAPAPSGFALGTKG